MNDNNEIDKKIYTDETDMELHECIMLTPETIERLSKISNDLSEAIEILILRRHFKDNNITINRKPSQYQSKIYENLSGLPTREDWDTVVINLINLSIDNLMDLLRSACEIGEVTDEETYGNLICRASTKLFNSLSLIQQAAEISLKYMIFYYDHASIFTEDISSEGEFQFSTLKTIDASLLVKTYNKITKNKQKAIKLSNEFMLKFNSYRIMRNKYMHSPFPESISISEVIEYFCLVSKQFYSHKDYMKIRQYSGSLPQYYYNYDESTGSLLLWNERNLLSKFLTRKHSIEFLGLNTKSKKICCDTCMEISNSLIGSYFNSAEMNKHLNYFECLICEQKIVNIQHELDLR